MGQIVILTGNLGRDPESRYMDSGTQVTNFSIATSEKWKDKDGNSHEETLWWKITAFGKLGEICNQYLKKGSKCQVVGKMKGDPQTGGPKIFKRTNGDSGASYELRAENVEFLSSRGEGQSEPVEDDSTIPF